MYKNGEKSSDYNLKTLRKRCTFHEERAMFQDRFGQVQIFEENLIGQFKCTNDFGVKCTKLLARL